MDSLERRATEFNEPSLFMAFVETTQELTQNFASPGIDLKDLAAHKKLELDVVSIEPGEIQENSGYDLVGLDMRSNA